MSLLLSSVGSHFSLAFFTNRLPNSQLTAAPTFHSSSGAALRLEILLYFVRRTAQRTSKNRNDCPRRKFRDLVMPRSSRRIPPERVPVVDQQLLWLVTHRRRWTLPTLLLMQGPRLVTNAVSPRSRGSRRHSDTGRSAAAAARKEDICFLCQQLYDCCGF